MHLNPGERAILSYYRNSDQAQKALQALKEAGFQKVQVDRIPNFSLYSDDSVRFHMLSDAPFSQATEPGAELSLYRGSSYTDYYPADPVENHTLMISLVVDQQNLPQALSIVKKYASIVN